MFFWLSLLIGWQKYTLNPKIKSEIMTTKQFRHLADDSGSIYLFDFSQAACEGHSFCGAAPLRSFDQVVKMY